MDNLETSTTEASALNMQTLLEAGMHFGHLTRRWNPKMKPYIYGVRHGIHIIDLSKTVQQLKKVLPFVAQAVGEGRDVLFVGTKRQAQDVIREEAERCQMFYVNQRWLGGTLTNFKTIKASIDRLNTLLKKKEEGVFEVLKKKERLMLDREIDKLLNSLGGIQKMKKIPGLMIVIDPNQEHIALHEANVLGIPVVALADTNCDPEAVDYLVAGNDDALRSIKIFISAVADQVLEGLKLRDIHARKAGEEKRIKNESKKGVREVEIKKDEAKKAYVAKGAEQDQAEEEGAEGQYSAKVEAQEPQSEGVAESEETVASEAEVATDHSEEKQDGGN